MASIGTLTTRVYTSAAQIPVQNATVAVTQKGTSGRATLLAVRVSDENGRTPPVRIATPDAGAGLAPGGAVPFAVCDIWCEHPGFSMLLVQDVQVFPGTETLQELELTPLPEQVQPTTSGEMIQITPQNL